MKSALFDLEYLHKEVTTGGYCFSLSCGRFIYHLTLTRSDHLNNDIMLTC